MNKILLFFITAISFISFQTYSQEPENTRDTSYYVPYDNDFNLIMAASYGHIENIIDLINRGADVNAVTSDGVTALMYASDNEDIEMMKILLQKGALVNVKPYNGMTALINACYLNHYTAAELLINSGADINLSDNYGVAPLHYAAAYDHVDILKMLIFYEANINKSDKEGNTPLITASYNNCIESVTILIEKADLNKQDKYGFTALMAASQQNNEDIVEILINNGADVNKVNEGGMTSLGLAVKSGNYKLTEFFIEKGADVNHRISNSQNILELSKTLDEDEITELLISNGAKNNRYPGFTKMSIGTGIIFYSREFMTGINTSLIDNKYNIILGSGFYFRPSAIRINTESINDTCYQFWERRYNYYIGFEKRYNLLQSGDAQTGPLAGTNALLTFGGYRGSNSNPETKILFNPYAGWYYMTDIISLSVKYEYANLDIPDFPTSRINFTFGFNISSKRNKLIVKKIKWLSKQS